MPTAAVVKAAWGAVAKGKAARGTVAKGGSGRSCSGRWGSNQAGRGTVINQAGRGTVINQAGRGTVILFRCTSADRLRQDVSLISRALTAEMHISRALTAELHISSALTAEMHISRALTAEMHISSALTAEMHISSALTAGCSRCPFSDGCPCGHCPRGLRACPPCLSSCCWRRLAWRRGCRTPGGGRPS